MLGSISVAFTTLTSRFVNPLYYQLPKNSLLPPLSPECYGAAITFMQPEANPLPAWALKEREQDRAWIRENISLFWETAVQGARIIGRGAIVVDVTARPMGEGNLFAYFDQAEIQRFQNEQIEQFVQTYLPEEEFVIALLKPERRVSSYRIRPLLNNNESNPPD